MIFVRKQNIAVVDINELTKFDGRMYAFRHIVIYIICPVIKYMQECLQKFIIFKK